MTDVGRRGRHVLLQSIFWTLGTSFILTALVLFPAAILRLKRLRQ
jgi:hypothetical protein